MDITKTAKIIQHVKTIEDLLAAEEAARVAKEADLSSGAKNAAYSEARTAVNKFLGRD